MRLAGSYFINKGRYGGTVQWMEIQVRWMAVGKLGNGEEKSRNKITIVVCGWQFLKRYLFLFPLWAKCVREWHHAKDRYVIEIRRGKITRDWRRKTWKTTTNSPLLPPVGNS